MKVLLDSDEISFLDETKEAIGDYINNEFLIKMLMICTKQQIQKKNFITKFNDFSLCIRKKMLKLLESDKFGTGEGSLPHREKELVIPGFIEKSRITRAVLIGFKYLKPKMEKYAKNNNLNLENYEDLIQSSFMTVLVIIARANIEFHFTQ